MDLEKVEEFLKKENRPWSLNDIHSKGFSAFPKNTLKNSLDILVKKNKIIKNENAYCYNFTNHSVNHNAEEVRQRIKKYSKKVKEKEEEIKKLEEALNNNNEEIPIAVLEKKLSDLRERIDGLEKKADELKMFNKNIQMANQIDLHGLQMKYDTCLREFNKRKIIGTSMLAQIMEIYPKPKQAVMEEIDVETDEMAGFDITKYPPSNDRKMPLNM